MIDARQTLETVLISEASSQNDVSNRRQGLE